MNTFFWVAFLLVAGYAVFVLFMYAFQGSMIYHPSRNILQTPEMLGLAFDKVDFEADDGTKLNGWFIPADSARGTILFSHGNAGNISGRIGTVGILHDLDMNVFLYDYRGYGKSGGTPTEQGTYSDVLGAWNYLRYEREIPADNIILMGRSLGGPVAAWIAVNNNAGGLILESTFTSAKDLASDLYPFLPVRMLMKFNYPTETYLRKLSIPVLVVHSKEDELVPFHHGRKLYTTAAEPKQFFEMKGGHGGGHIESGPAYGEALNTFFELALNGKTN